MRGAVHARPGSLSAAEQDVWSVAELDLTKVVAGSKILAEAWANPELSTPAGPTLPTPDLWLDDVGLAVQLHSRTYHERNEDWDGTVMADSALGELGVVVLPLTPNRITKHPAEVRRRIERCYLSLRGRRRPDIVAEPRSMY